MDKPIWWRQWLYSRKILTGSWSAPGRHSALRNTKQTLSHTTYYRASKQPHPLSSAGDCWGQHVACQLPGGRTPATSRIPPHIKFPINMPTNSASSLSWYPRIQQSTSIWYTRILDISWFLVHSLSDCCVSFMQIYKHILWALPNPLVCLFNQRLTLYGVNGQASLSLALLLSQYWCFLGSTRSRTSWLQSRVAIWHSLSSFLFPFPSFSNVMDDKTWFVTNGLCAIMTAT